MRTSNIWHPTPCKSASWVQYSAGMDAKSTLLSNLGRTVRAARQARSWTRRELAQRSGVSERFLAEIENGRGNPSLARLFDLAVSLDTTPEGLLRRPALKDPEGEGRRIVALLGLRGAGKSSVGARLAERLACGFVELDQVVEEQSGLSLAEMFELHGQGYFRRQERLALEHLLEQGEPLVLATGGGIVTEPATFELLRKHAHTVWLKAQPQDHWSRVVAQGDMRPMQGDDDEAYLHLVSILEERERLYEQAHVTVETSGCSLDEVCEALARRFESAGV